MLIFPYWPVLIKIQKLTNVGKDVKGTLIVENINQSMEKKGQRFIKFSSLELACDPEIPLLGRQRKEQN